MVEWLETFKKQKGWERYRLYYPEGNLVVIVPNIDRFSMPGQFEQFVERMKPRLLKVGLQRFNASPEDFGHAITTDTFDEYFDLSVRESAMLMSDFEDAEKLCEIAETG